MHRTCSVAAFVVLASATALMLRPCYARDRTPTLLTAAECRVLLGGDCNEAVNCDETSAGCACANQGCSTAGCTADATCTPYNGVCFKVTTVCQKPCGQSSSDPSAKCGCDSTISDVNTCATYKYSTFTPDPGCYPSWCNQTHPDGCGGWQQTCMHRQCPDDPS